MALEVTGETATGLGVLLAAVLSAGKYFRMQRADAAQTDANIAGSNAAKAANEHMEALQRQVQNLNTASIQAANDINALKGEIAQLRAGYLPAVMMLPTITLCANCGERHQNTLDYVISHLQTMAPPPSHPADHDHASP